MKKTTKILAAAIAAVVVGLPAFAAKKTDKVKTIYVGVTVDSKYGYLDDKGNYVGYEAELLRAVDEALPQYEFKYEFGKLDAILLGLSTGKYEIGLKQFESNPDRRKNYLFSEDGYLCYDSYLTVLKENNDIHSFDDLRGKPVLGSSHGSAFATYLENYNKSLPAGATKINIVYASYASHEETLAALRNGTIVATTMPKSIIRDYNKQFGDVVKAAEKEPHRKSDAYVLFNKKQTQLKKDFDAALHELIVSGKLSEISQRTLGYDYKDN
ncbi:MAG: transporter substrate-binding domain-containing protein [Treponema sp.]|nr:transporter substrate-binding domain-containing protein [Treponema sp.]